MQLVIFSVQNKLYGIPSENVEEITGALEWTDVPQTPDWLLGLINLRGNVISLLHFEQFLNIQGKDRQSKKLCYNNSIIVKRDKNKTAFAVDKVEEVIDIDEDDIQLQGNPGHIIQGVFSRHHAVVNLVHLETLFSKNEGSI